MISSYVSLSFWLLLVITGLLIWRFGFVGNVDGRISKVNQRWARLLLGWVIICRWVNHLGM